MFAFNPHSIHALTVREDDHKKSAKPITTTSRYCQPVAPSLQPIPTCHHTAEENTGLRLRPSAMKAPDAEQDMISLASP